MPTLSSRRSFLGAAATAGFALTQITGDALAAGGALHQDEFLENGAGKFKVDIPGCGVVSSGIQSVEVEDITIDLRETTTGADWDYRTYAPGDAHFGKATFTARGDAACKALMQWAEEAAKGQASRKSISVVCLKRDGTEDRRWNFVDAVPEKVGFAPDFPRCQGVPSLALAVRPLRVEMVPAVQDTAEPAAAGGCGGRSLAPPRAQDLRRSDQAWAVHVTDVQTGKMSSWSGVSAFAPKLPIRVDLAAPPKDPWPGRAYIEEITLRGPLTAQRRQWVQDAVTAAGPQGRRFDLTIVEIMKDGRDGKTYAYSKCFLTRYVYPVLSADGTGNLYEEVSLKPERLEMR